MTRKQKRVQEWIDARIAAGKGLSQSLRTYGLRVGLVTARDLPPSESPEPWSEKTTASPPGKPTNGKSLNETSECEFNLPDEDRFYPLTHYACPICRSEARLWRTDGGKRGQIQFQVQCINKFCGHKTGWHPSSNKATRIWKVTATLHEE